MITNAITFKKESLPPLVKVTDVAKLLSLSRCSVHSLIDSGDLVGSRINPLKKRRNHVRVTRNSLLKFYRKRFGHSLILALADKFEP